MSSNKQDKNKRNKWIALINIPIQMGIIIFAGVYFGLWLDNKFNKGESLFIIITSLLAVFIALYNVIRQVKNLGGKT